MGRSAIFERAGILFFSLKTLDGRSRARTPSAGMSAIASVPLAERLRSRESVAAVLGALRARLSSERSWGSAAWWRLLASETGSSSLRRIAAELSRRPTSRARARALLDEIASSSASASWRPPSFRRMGEAPGFLGRATADVAWWPEVRVDSSGSCPASRAPSSGDHLRGLRRRGLRNLSSRLVPRWAEERRLRARSATTAIAVISVATTDDHRDFGRGPRGDQTLARRDDRDSSGRARRLLGEALEPSAALHDRAALRTELDVDAAPPDRRGDGPRSTPRCFVRLADARAICRSLHSGRLPVAADRGVRAARRV